MLGDIEMLASVSESEKLRCNTSDGLVIALELETRCMCARRKSFVVNVWSIDVSRFLLVNLRIV
jgi:hypothetical protein